MRGIGRRVVAQAGATLTLAAGAVAAMGVAAPAQDTAAEVVEMVETAATVDSGDTAWMLTSTALVLMMTIPGLALFYAGMVRKMNALATMMQSFAICCLATIVWMVAAYSLSFGPGNWFIGDFSNLFLENMGVDSMSGTIPESVFMTFQMTFAIITPALITGAIADRMKFSGLMLFVTLWLLLVYAPVCHMVWGGGLMARWGVLDFAGGTVVHINAGVAGLVACLVLGKRAGYGKTPFPPHNLGLSLIGASLLWVGWFGFNAGSALSAGAGAGMALAVTQVATAAAALAWMAAEWIIKGKPSILGIISGAVAGLVAITPASGFVLPSAALAIGLAAGVLCFFASTAIKNALGYDDSLDVWGVHGVGGIVGAVLTGVFATRAVTGGEDPVGMIDGNAGQIVTQIQGVLVTLVYGGGASFILLMVARAVTGIRVGDDAEREGLDLALHGEQVP